jgi:hypothetical protein
VKPFARRMDLGEWKIPSSASGLSKTLFNVKPLSDARTPLADFFSILLVRLDDSFQGNAFFNEHDRNIFSDWIQYLSVGSYQPSIEGLRNQLIGSIF